jgi:hypothetical protein
MEIATLIVSIIGSLGAIAAVFFAYNAWRKPQPDLDFVHEKARFIRGSSRRYFLEVQANVMNSSPVNAMIDEVKINDVSLKGKKEKTVSLDEWEVKKVSLYKFGNIWPRYSLRANNSLSEGFFKVVVDVGEKRPKKIIVKIITTKRKFSFPVRNFKFIQNIEDW